MKILPLKPRRALVSVMILIVALTVMSTPALAQCPLCKLSLENSSQAATFGRGLNLGILVLLVPPVTIFCSIFFLAFKYRKAEKF